MKLNLKNNGHTVQLKIELDSGWSADLGTLSVDEAEKVHAEIVAMADRLAIWLRGHGVKLP